MGTKRKLKAKIWRQNKAVIHPRVSAQAKVAEFSGQTFIEEHGELICQACRKRLVKGKKTTLVNHCKGIHHVQAVGAFKKKETSKQVCDFCCGSFFVRYSSITFDVVKESISKIQIKTFITLLL